MSLIKVKSTSIDGTLGDELRPNAQPLIINGDMSVAQRGTSFSPSGSSTYTVDRFKYEATSGATGDATITQESDAPANTNFRKSLKISPDATETLSGGENICFTTSLEGQDVQVLGHGTSSPPKATLSFWVKSSKTGTYCVQIKEEEVTDESYLLFEYTISSANTWEQKIITWTGNTAHTLDDDNAMGLRIVWSLAVGSSDHASATTSWTSATPFKATSNQVNFFDNTSNNWYITGVQLEVGEFTSATLPAFQHESFAENYHRCCRYFFRRGEISRLGYGVVSAHASNLAYGAQVYFPTIMRATPSQSHTDTSGFYFTGAGQNQTLVVGGTIANEGISKFGVSVGGQASGSLGIGNAYWFNTTGSPQYIQWDAEL